MMRTAVDYVETMSTGPGHWFDDAVMAQAHPAFRERSMVGGPAGTYVETRQSMKQYSLASGVCKLNGRPHIYSSGEAQINYFSQLYDGDHGWQRSSTYNSDKTHHLRFRIYTPINLEWDSAWLRVTVAGPAKLVARGPVADLWDEWEGQIRLALRRARPFRAEIGGMAEMYAVTRRDEWDAAVNAVLPACP